MIGKGKGIQSPWIMAAAHGLGVRAWLRVID
jgi:hypothetical protein